MCMGMDEYEIDAAYFDCLLHLHLRLRLGLGI